MRRIRIVFLLLAVVLLVPMGLLVQRALESVALERRVSHRAVAERLLDEMERELSRILRAEEERPFSDYPFEKLDLASGAKASGKLARAAVPTPSPWVAGYFQIDADGTFRGESSAVAAAGAPQQALDKIAATDLKDVVERNLATGFLGQSGQGEVDPEIPPPGASRERERADASDDRAPASEGATVALESKITDKVSPYQALQSLNRAVVARKERQAKRAAPQPEAGGIRGSVLQSTRSQVEAPPDSGRYAAAKRVTGIAAATKPDARANERRAKLAVPELAADLAEADVDEAVASEIFEEAAPGEPAPATREPVVEVHPMLGRLIDGEQLLLHRTVLLGDQSFRQGLVVSLPALIRHLDQSVVAGSQLADFVARDFFTVGSIAPRRGRPGAFEYVHRFAEPFDALAVRLILSPLPGVAGNGYLYAIAVLLLVSGTVGLLALYRMVAVTVRFAERRNNFVASVSHELKTPLTAIRMYAEMLRDGMVEDDEKRAEYYQTLTAESERLTRLINNVLEFSRLEKGTREMNLVAGAIGPVVAEAAELLRPHVREDGFGIDVEIEENLPTVRFERDAVLQVVFNLVDNALKYARDGGERKIRLRCARDAEGVVLSVRDHGNGVSAKHLSRIFEPFYRGESELTRTAKGTGIGLALVQGLAESMGAAVSGRNHRDGGFEVALTFRASAPA